MRDDRKQRGRSKPVGATYRIDLVVEDLVVVEVKSVAALLAVHQAQVITYLKLAGYPVGLLINFNVPRLMDGVKRLIHPRLLDSANGVTSERSCLPVFAVTPV
jgi:PD-(D/E)XK nuclease superfamily protein